MSGYRSMGPAPEDLGQTPADPTWDGVVTLWTPAAPAAGQPAGTPLWTPAAPTAGPGAATAAEPTAPQPTVFEPAARARATREPATAEPAAPQPAVFEPAGGGPAAGEPAAGAPAAGGVPTGGGVSTGGGVPTGGPVPPERLRRWAAAALAVLALATAGMVGGAVEHLLSRRSAGAGAAAGQAGGGPVQPPLATMIAAVSPSVVSIAVTSGSGTTQGSGVVIDCAGLVLTNDHVVTSARTSGSITIVFADGTSAPATVEATDPGRDLALLRTPMVFGLTAATLGSGQVQVGDTVIAIGNALGLPGSVSVGVISAMHRTVTVKRSRPSAQGGASTTLVYQDALQTDAEINEGNSGGPLFNAGGQVIGINSVMGSDGTSTGSIGIGFAIPVDQVRQFIAGNEG